MERSTQYHGRLTEVCNAHSARIMRYARAKGNPCMLLLLLISLGQARIEDCAIIIHWSTGNWPPTTWYRKAFVYLIPCLRVAHRFRARTGNGLYSHLPSFEEVRGCYQGMHMAVDGKPR